MVGNFRLPIAGRANSARDEDVPSPNAKFVRLPGGRWFVFLLALFLFTGRLNAVPQFDVFLGYDGIVPEASWFPVVCEIKNDGPPFRAVIEVSPNFGEGQTRQVPVELPTGTLKRITIPVFASTAGYASWDIRLIDERGKVRVEKLGERPQTQVSAGTPILGAIMRNGGSKPLVRPLASLQDRQQPPSAAMLPAILPDNPLVLEGMTALYLSSMRAPELRDPEQVQAIYAWLNAGGHLIVGVEQLSDIVSVKWLNALFPIELQDIKSVARHSELQQWIATGGWVTNAQPRNAYPQYGGRMRPQRRTRPGQPTVLPQDDDNSPKIVQIADDPKFEVAPLQVAIGKLRDGKVIVPEMPSADTPPLIVTAPRGRGRITVLLFSPEREPCAQWKNLPTFWSKIADIPANWYSRQNAGGTSSDSIFFAMLESRQVHKLPLEWLLVLLIVYLVVIGPLDRYWLKKINRPMLTWITFPCYVVAFSFLIYFIGYKLRAGEAEWNELHIVDVLPNGEKSELRGRTYASVYAPSNERYRIESGQKYATLRGEFSGLRGGGSAEKATIIQNGDSFKGEIYIPVWTSQMYVSDWWEGADTPVTANITKQDSGWRVDVENHSDQKLAEVQIVIEDLIYRLGEIPASQAKTFQVNSGQGTDVRDFVAARSSQLQTAANSRQSAFGRTDSGHLDDLPNCTVAASFLSGRSPDEDSSGYYSGNFVTPPGLDLSADTGRGTAVLFAWAEDYSPVKPMYQVKPKRSHKNTMFRVPVLVQSPKPKAQS